MKIFLTSSAANVLERIVQMLDKKPNEYKVVFIPTAGDLYTGPKPWEWADRNKLVELGFNVEDFDLKNKNIETVRKKIDEIDIIFVAGGNTFYLLQEAKRSGFEAVMRDLKESNKIYMGSSAGSCIAGPDLEPIATIDNPEDAQLDSTRAFGLTDFVILPHNNDPKYAKIHQQIIKSFGDKYKIITLRDDQLIINENNKTQTLTNENGTNK